MPPKPKFTREEIVAAAYEMVRSDGFDVLTARALGAKLSSSSCPIFTVFESMDEVKDCVLKKIKAEYARYVEEGLKMKPSFKGVGMKYIEFACREPQFFRILFMTELDDSTVSVNVLLKIEEHYPEILQSVEDLYGLGKEYSEKLYLHLWIYTHGIATLCATKMCTFTQEEMSGLLSDICPLLVKEYKRRIEK